MTADGKSGSSSSSSSAGASSEKPHHYSYLKEFRVEQCPLFLQHKCTQHRPFTCFHWHFMNQRRRRPVRKRDGAFSYSPDVYCTSYDETTGICPDGDDCPLLHRTAGDTERRYHLRYFKTAPCVHETDSRGHCVKNGVHCAFSHGVNDLRPPVFDAKEVEAFTNHRGGGGGGDFETSTPISGSNALLPNNLDNRDRGLAEDPKWQCTTFVLTNYKTDQCRRPPRLCRQGYACPQYHNNKDRRRSPKTFKYRSTPCPNVKHGDEWGEPTNCESGDHCAYCHTRTEQQFHPEIYKSTKCNDMLQKKKKNRDLLHQAKGRFGRGCHPYTQLQRRTGYCPRGPFCAFAHIDEEINSFRDSMTDQSGNDEDHSLAGYVNNALPSEGSAGQNAGTPTSANPPSGNGANDSSATHNNVHAGEKEVEIDVFNIANVAAQANSGNSNNGRGRSSVSSSSNFHHNQISAEDSFSSSDLSSSGTWQNNWPQNKMDMTAGMRREILEIENDFNLNEAEKAQRKQEVLQRRLNSGGGSSSSGGGGVAVPRTGSVGSGGSVFVRHHRLSSTSSGISSSSALGGSGSPLNAYFSLGDTVESVLANGLEDLDIDDLNIENIEVEHGVQQDPGEEPNSASSSFSASFGSPMGLALGRSLPISIPDGAMLNRPQVASGTSGPPGFGDPNAALSTSGASSMSPLSTVAMNVANIQQPALRQRAFSLGQQHAQPTMQQIRDTIAAAGLLGQPGRFNPSAGLSPGSGNGNQSSPLLSSSLFALPQGLQRTSAGSLPDHAGNLGAAELLRLQEEVLSSRSTLAAWEESMLQARKACDAWKKEAEESKLLVGKVEADKLMALQQRDEAAGKYASLLQELERVGVTNQHMKCLQRHEELDNLPLQQVLVLQQQLRQDLERIEKTLYHHHHQHPGASQAPPPGFPPQQQPTQQQQQTQISGNNPPVSSSS